jgi:hypothetical protein
MKIKKDVLTPKWLVIKEMFEKNTNGSSEYGTNFPIGGELDTLCYEFLDMVAEITLRNGFNCVVEGVRMDIWKSERVWNIIEKAGLLEDIAWKLDLEEYEEKEDTWYLSDPEFEDDEYFF